MIDLHCLTCGKVVAGDASFCGACGARAHEAVPQPEKITIYLPHVCTDPRLKPLHNKLLATMSLAGDVRDVVIHEALKGDVQMLAATFDSATLVKRLEGVPFWLRKMIGL
jgi:NMD protein affecting ribosome stability and mRNA decay